MRTQMKAMFMALFLLTFLIKPGIVAAKKKPDTKSAIIQCENSEKESTIDSIMVWKKAVNAKEITGTVACGESVRILSPLNPYTKVRTQDGKEGYVAGRYEEIGRAHV